jgi:hypothetical protein
MGKFLQDARICRNDPKRVRGGENEDEPEEIPQYKPLSEQDVKLMMEATSASPMLREITGAWPCAYAEAYYADGEEADEPVTRYRIVRDFGFNENTLTMMSWAGFQPRALTVEEAGVLVKQMLYGTVYRDPCDMLHGLSLLLMPVLRPAINGATPMYVVTGPAGAGKSYLFRIVGELLGYAELRPLAEWGAEAERQLSAQLLAGSPMNYYDDLAPAVLGEGGTPLLCAAITAGDRPMTIRPMGKSEERSARPRCIWGASMIETTGLTEAAARRLVEIRIKREDARRRIQVDRKIRENRSLYVEALCTLVTAWSEAGCAGEPDEASPPSFSDWHTVVGRCAVWTAQNINLAHNGKALSPAEWARAWLAHKPRASTNAHEELQQLIACWIASKDDPAAQALGWSDAMTTAELAKACSSSGLGLALLGSDTNAGYVEVGRQLSRLATTEVTVTVEGKKYRLHRKATHPRAVWTYVQCPSRSRR